MAEGLGEPGTGGPAYWQLIVWQKAMAMARSVYTLVPGLPREETYAMRSQLTRAAVSVPTNIAEGWTRESRAEKAQFLAIAHGSLAEAETLLSLCEQIGWFPSDETAKSRSLMLEVSRMLTAMRRGTRNEKRGDRN